MILCKLILFRINLRVCHKVSPLQFLGTDYTDFVLKPHAKVQLY